MHALFIELFIQTDEDDLLAEEDRRRRVRRSRRARPALVVRPAAGRCAGRMAQEFGDHPDAAARRMRWVRQLFAQEPAAPRRAA